MYTHIKDNTQGWTGHDNTLDTERQPQLSTSNNVYIQEFHESRNFRNLEATFRECIHQY